MPPANSVTELRPVQSQPAAGPTVQPYDFRRPNKLSRDHARVLEMICDTFARRLTTLLTSGLRQVCRVEQQEVAQSTYDEYINTLPTPTLLIPVALPPLAGAATLQMSLPIALAAIDHMLGGPGGHQEPRGLTDIELNLFSGLLDQILDVLRYALDPLVQVAPSAGPFEYNPQFLQAHSGSDSVIVGDFTMTIGEESSRLSISLPLSSLTPRLDAMRPKEVVDNGHLTAAAMRESLSDVPVEVTVAFAPTRIDSSRVLTLDEGAVIVLGHRVGAPLDVQVSGSRIASAVAGKSGAKLAALVVDNLSATPPPVGALSAPSVSQGVKA